MELKHIKDLMAVMGRTGTKRLRIKQDNFELELENESAFSYSETSFPRESYEVSTAPRQPDKAKVRSNDIPASLHPPLEHPDLKKEAPGKLVASPMVGTFYTSPGPDEPVFVKVGDQVSKDTVVCIIEAMKVMNEIRAGIEGTVAEVLVETGRPVEFGTKLFRIS